MISRSSNVFKDSTTVLKCIERQYEIESRVSQWYNCLKGCVLIEFDGGRVVGRVNLQYVINRSN